MSGKHRLDEKLRRYGHWPNGNWWCPDCGKWIEYGDAKLTSDSFQVHRWCK